MRCGGLLAADILGASAQLFGPGAEGAFVAQTGAVRAIVAPYDPTVRLFYIYEDPYDGNDRHAVIRFNDNVPRGLWDEARRQLKAAFAKRVA